MKNINCPLAEQVVYYIEPGDSKANAVIAEECSGATEQREMLCGDKKKRNLWEVRFEDVVKLIRSKEQFGLSFSVFRRIGEGDITPAGNFLFGVKKPKKKEPVVFRGVLLPPVRKGKLTRVVIRQVPVSSLKT